MFVCIIRCIRNIAQIIFIPSLLLAYHVYVEYFIDKAFTYTIIFDRYLGTRRLSANYECESSSVLSYVCLLMADGTG